MNLQGVIVKKYGQSQAFLEDGTRVPVSVLSASGNLVTQVKTQDKDGYNAVQLGFETKKRSNKAILGHSKKAGLEKAARFFQEIRLENPIELNIGDKINPQEVLEAGDIVDITGVSKGKGFAGVVKRHGFKGGPRTHGQSDRERAPGSIGQTTTPGRVYKGKRMAGRMGHEQVTIKNLLVLEVKEDGTILVKGLVPGSVNNILLIKKVGQRKKFIPLYKEIIEEPEEVTVEAKEEPKEEIIEEIKTQEDVKTPEDMVEEPKEEVKTEEDVKTQDDVVETVEEEKTEEQEVLAENKPDEEKKEEEKEEK